MKKTSSPSSLTTKKYTSLNLNSVYKPNGTARPGQNGRMLLGTVKKGGGVKKAPPPAAPKPLNLPSQKKENAGYDPKVALVPSGGSGWSGADGPPPTNPSAEHPDAPEPIPTAGPAAPVPDAPAASTSPPKSMAWGGRGMTKPATAPLPTPPPQMMPTRPTEELNRFNNPAGRWGGSAVSAGGLNRRTPAGEQWPTLAPKEEEGVSLSSSPPASSSNGILQEKINTERDDSWADVDDEMSYDDADNLFNDAVTKKPPQKESELSPEEARALQIMRAEAAERKREAEERARREEAEAAAAATEARNQEAGRLKQEAARAVEAAMSKPEPAPELEPEPEPEPEPAPAAPVEEPVDIGAAMKSQAESARERRQREEEQRQAEQKARADERLRVLNEAADKRKEEERKRKEEQQRLEDAKREEENQLRGKQEEEQRKFQTKNAWHAPERPNPADVSSWRDRPDGDAESRQDLSPNSILKRDTSRRKLWVPESEREKHERPTKVVERVLDRDRAAYEKKFNISDHRNWRDRAEEAKEKEKDEKKKRDREKGNAKKAAPMVAKVEKKSEVKSQAKEEGKRPDARKKDAPPAISLPAPLPKEGEEVPDKQPSDQAPETDSKVPKASWSLNRLKKYIEQNAIKKWCEQQNIPIKMQDKDDLLSKYKLWAQAKEKGEISGEKAKRTKTTRRGKKEENTKKGEGGEDVDDDGKKHRTARGARKTRKDESPKGSPKDEKPAPKTEDHKGESKPETSKPGLVLDEQMGLQDIACGLRVGPDGGYAVVDSHETVEDDSGFTTEVNKKEKKAQLREEAQQKEKVARRQRIKDAAKANKEAKAKAEAAKTEVGSENNASAVAPVYPTPIATEAPPHPIQDLTAKSVTGPTKQAWGPNPSTSEKANFTSIMLDQKFKQTFPEERMPFEAPVPKDPLHPAPAGSAVGAERTFPGSNHDIWTNSSATPVPSSAPFNTIPFDTGVGGSAFASGNFNSAGAGGSQPYGSAFMNPMTDGLMMRTLTPQIAQFTALPSFNRYNHAFSAAPGGANLDGWGASGDPAQNAFQHLGSQDAAGWSDQKAVGPARQDDPNGPAHPSNGKGSSDRANRKPRGGKSRGGGKDNKAKDNSSAPKSKDASSAKTDQATSGQGRGGRQTRGKGQGSAGKPPAKGSEKTSTPVDAVIPAKAGNRRGGRKKANPASDKN